MTKKEEEEKKKKPTVMETYTADSVMKRRTITLPKDLMEPETPQPKVKKKKEKSNK